MSSQPRPRHAQTPSPAPLAGGRELAGSHVTLLRWLAILGSVLMLATAVQGEAASKKRAVTGASTGLKAPVQGLLDRHHEPKAGHTNDVKNFVVDTSWASLQPQRGGPIVHPNDIDKAVAFARQHGMGLKLRVGAGIYAPEWAKHIGGDPVTFYYASASKRTGELAGTVGRFWHPEFGTAYEDLQNKLAALYDDVPEVRGLVVTRCQTIFSETYLRNTQDGQSTKALLQAGFTRAADDVCHNEQIAAHKVWQRTRSEVAFNPYQAIQADGSVKQDEAYAMSQMDFCRSTLGPRCILANYSISAGRPGSPGYAEVYGHMAKLGAPIAFQTATASKIGNWQATLDWAVRAGASSVELPTGYDAWSASVLGEHAERLAANPVDADTTPSTGGGGGSGGGSGGSTTGAVKPPVQGLLDRHHYPKKGYAGAVDNFVVSVSWSSLQPQQAGPIVHPNEIDRAIEVANRDGMGLKLRVRAGIDAPDWAKHLGGDPVTFYYTSATTKRSGQLAGTVGRFWTSQFGSAYVDLQTKLAALYDDVPELRTVNVTRCQTIYSETYLRNAQDKRSAERLLAAGFSRALDDLCHNEQIQVHRVWEHTRSELTFNPYQAIQPDGSVKQDEEYTESQMDYCRAVLGPRCILANNSLSSSRTSRTGPKGYASMYAHMASLGAPIAFQTATSTKIGNWQTSLAAGAAMGANSVELPTGYDHWSPGGLATFANRLTDNPVD